MPKATTCRAAIAAIRPAVLTVSSRRQRKEAAAVSGSAGSVIRWSLQHLVDERVSCRGRSPGLRVVRFPARLPGLMVTASGCPARDVGGKLPDHSGEGRTGLDL